MIAAAIHAFFYCSSRVVKKRRLVNVALTYQAARKHALRWPALCMITRTWCYSMIRFQPLVCSWVVGVFHSDLRVGSSGEALAKLLHLYHCATKLLLTCTHCYNKGFTFGLQMCTLVNIFGASASRFDACIRVFRIKLEHTVTHAWCMCLLVTAGCARGQDTPACYTSITISS